MLVWSEHTSDGAGPGPVRGGPISVGAIWKGFMEEMASEDAGSILERRNTADKV